jgi:hypothetical protein
MVWQTKVLFDHHLQALLAYAQRSRYPVCNRATERCNWLTNVYLLASCAGAGACGKKREYSRAARARTLINTQVRIGVINATMARSNQRHRVADVAL